MKPSVFLVALYVFFLTFSLLGLFFGETGVIALDKIRIRNQSLAVNLAVLDSKNAELSAKLMTLRSDSESIVIGARALGLYQTDDKVVQFRNLNSVHSLPDAGSVLHLVPLRRADESLLRVLSISAGIIFLLFSLMVWKLRDAAQKK